MLGMLIYCAVSPYMPHPPFAGMPEHGASSAGVELERGMLLNSELQDSVLEIELTRIDHLK